MVRVGYPNPNHNP